MRSSTSSMLEYIAALARQLDGFDTEYIILVMLMELEFEESHDGFDYLRTAIYIFAEEKESLITQSLYSAVASCYGRKIKESAIERAIRTAIEAAWENHSGMLYAFFPSEERPSNIKFIARMARCLELWKGCCKANRKESSKEVVQDER